MAPNHIPTDDPSIEWVANRSTAQTMLPDKMDHRHQRPKANPKRIIVGITSPLWHSVVWGRLDPLKLKVPSCGRLHKTRVLRIALSVPLAGWMLAIARDRSASKRCGRLTVLYKCG